MTGIFTSPTAVRMLMRYGDEPLLRDRPLAARACRLRGRSAQRAGVGLAAEHGFSTDRVPVIDHMWQTETGGPVFGNPYGIEHAADQARLGGDPAARHRRRRRDARRRAVRRRARRASWCSSARSRG